MRIFPPLTRKKRDSVTQICRGVDNSIVVHNSHFKKCDNHTSVDVNFTFQEMWKSHSNNTNINNTELNDTDNLFLPQDCTYGQGTEDERKEGNERAKYHDMIKNKLTMIRLSTAIRIMHH